MSLTLLVLACSLTAVAVQEDPARIGFVYPAGGQQGSTFEARVGGTSIYGATDALVSGTGVTVRVLDARDPAPPKDEQQRRQRKRRRQSVIEEVVKLSVSIASNAVPGDREIRLVSPNGLSNPLVFQVGQVREIREAAPNDRGEAPMALPGLPVLVNGQILPGDADAFTFTARRGQRLLVEVSARTLIPYLADAVPGWFQAIVKLHDDGGREVACVDDYRFSPDPVLFFDVPADGAYRLTIRDSIYRGRADFVYRIKLGELPFITGVFPLGARQGNTPVPVTVSGWNLPGDTLRVAVDRPGPGVLPLTITRGDVVSPPVRFAVGGLPEAMEDETATRRPEGQALTPPVVVNGRIRAPGETDVYRFEGRQGQKVRLDIEARRLGSPLDSHIVLSDRRGNLIVENDDVRDPGQGLLTHVADSELTVDLSADGPFTLRVRDTQGKGGEDYAYRLRVAPPEPDFELRATPASLTVPQGGSVPLTLHAIRRCGFEGGIRLELDPASAPGCTLDGGYLPPGTNRIHLTLSASGQAPAGLRFPVLRGTARVADATVSRPVTPAEDLMQAFIYQHLVPARECVVAVTAPAVPFRVLPQLGPEGVLELPLGRETSFTVRATRRPGYDGFIRLQLEDPPKGITLRKPGIPPGRDRAFITIRTESKVDVRQGNLMITALMPLEPGAGGGGGIPKVRPAVTNAGPAAAGRPGRTGLPWERVSVTLAAVPFRVVDDPGRTHADAGHTDKD